MLADIDWDHLGRVGRMVADVWAFGLCGILLMFVGYWIFDKLTPKIDFARELVENKNIAVAIMVASVIFGVAVIVAAIMLPWPGASQQ
jgi:uncharacterized membrane protein YjfL (UPF0719 family)